TGVLPWFSWLSETSYSKIGQRLIFPVNAARHNAPHVGKTKQQLQLLTWIRVDWRPPPYTPSEAQRLTTRKKPDILEPSRGRRRAQENRTGRATGPFSLW